MMKLPKITGMIDRRILINFRVDPEIIAKILPQPFRPFTHKGQAIAGICLIRFKHLRPKGFPEFMGMSSENAAHRIAVEWDDNGTLKKGVYVPRRDTSLWINSLAGGRIFPGKQYLSDFEVNEQNQNYHIHIKHKNESLIAIEAEKTSIFPQNSIFDNLQQVSDFFEQGSLGYSPGQKHFDGIRLHTFNWSVESLRVNYVQSSFFADKSIFPDNSVTFDNALLMTNINHEWISEKDICKT